MAKKLATETASQDAKSNIKPREDAIRDALEERYQLDRKIKSAMDKYVQPHRDAKNDITKMLRKDYQIPAKLFNVRYASYKLERFAQDSGDNETLMTLRDMQRIAPIGGSADLVEAIEATTKARSAKPASGETSGLYSDAYQDGRHASMRGEGADKNPHAAGSKKVINWERGRAAHQVELAEGLAATHQTQLAEGLETATLSRTREPSKVSADA